MTVQEVNIADKTLKHEEERKRNKHSKSNVGLKKPTQTLVTRRYQNTSVHTIPVKGTIAANLTVT